MRSFILLCLLALCCTTTRGQQAQQATDGGHDWSRFVANTGAAVVVAF